MVFGTMSQQCMSAFQRESSSVDAIKSHSKELVTLLSIAFRGQASKANFHLQFSNIEDPRYLCKVLTTLGGGVMRLALDFKDGEVMGVILIEREKLDERHFSVWETVWKITIPPYGDLFGGGGPDPVRISFDSNRLDSAILKLGLHIAYAIGTGPLTGDN